MKENHHCAQLMTVVYNSAEPPHHQNLARKLDAHQCLNAHSGLSCHCRRNDHLHSSQRSCQATAMKMDGRPHFWFLVFTSKISKQAQEIFFEWLTQFIWLRCGLALWILIIIKLCYVFEFDELLDIMTIDPLWMIFETASTACFECIIDYLHHFNLLNDIIKLWYHRDY